MTIICFDRIEIGENVLVSWDTLVMDNDFHDIIDLSTHSLFGKTGHIAIGNNCWICYGATI